MSTSSLQPQAQARSQPWLNAEPIDPERRHRRATIVVGGLWVVLLAATLGYVAHYGSNIPYMDDYALVSVLTGHEPATPQWFWSQHNEHRLLLPRVVLYSLGRLTRQNFLMGQYLNVLLLGGLAAVMLLAARQLRGRTVYTDAFFPLLLLQWSQYETFLWAFEIQFVLSSTLACVLLLLIARCAQLPGGFSLLLAGLCLLGLPLCGANGLPYVPPLAMWMAYAGFVRLRTGSGKGASVFMLAAAVASLALLGLNYLGYREVPHGGDLHPGLGAQLSVSLQFLGMSAGTTIVRLWPAIPLALLALSLVTVWVLGHTWRRRPEERVRAAGLLLFLAGVAALALGVGLGRAWVGEWAGTASRYSTLAFPLLCCLYVAWELYGHPRLRRWLQVGLLCLLCGLLGHSIRHGIEAGQRRLQEDRQLQADVRAGLSCRELAEQHVPFQYPEVAPFEQCLEMLRAAGRDPFPANSPATRKGPSFSARPSRSVE